MTNIGEEVSTRGGSFGPGGYGGGVFDGSMQISGLGGIGIEGTGDAYGALPQAYGLRSTASRAYQEGSLGLPPAPGLEATASQAYEDGSLGDCYGVHVHDASAPTSVSFGAVGSGILPWRQYDSRTEELQRGLNAALGDQGFQLLGVDGVLGPKTCGAISWLGGLGLSVSETYHVNQPGLRYLLNIASASEGASCEATTYPTRVGGGVHVPVSTRPTAALPWGTESAETYRVQGLLNATLIGHGYLPITVDGQLGPRTCGAMRMAKRDWGMNWETEFGGNCQSYVEPTRGAAVTTTPGIPVPGAPPPLPEITTAGIGGGGISTAVVVGGLLGAAVLGGLWYAGAGKKN